MRVKIYGCRGSSPVCRNGSRYGGNTSCMTVESSGELLILDAGSGITTLQEELYGKNGTRKDDKEVHILISHLHLDHIIGLGTFAPAWSAESKAKIYTCSRNEKPLHEQVLGAFKPPYWPVEMQTHSTAEIIPIQAKVSFKIGCFTITPFLAQHPDITLSFHITDGKKKIVHLLDSETTKMTQTQMDEQARFCENADMVIFDAAYSQEEYPRYDGWGHSTAQDGVKLAGQWNCKRMMFCHLGRHYTDAELDSWMNGLDPNKFIMAFDGLEMEV